MKVSPIFALTFTFLGGLLSLSVKYLLIDYPSKMRLLILDMKRLNSRMSASTAEAQRANNVLDESEQCWYLTSGLINDLKLRLSATSGEPIEPPHLDGLIGEIRNAHLLLSDCEGKLLSMSAGPASAFDKSLQALLASVQTQKNILLRLLKGDLKATSDWIELLGDEERIASQVNHSLRGMASRYRIEVEKDEVDVLAMQIERSVLQRHRCFAEFGLAFVILAYILMTLHP